jgi:TP901 family phage tail tape measure protein
MASSFNLTAQINLQGPANLKPVVAKIKRSLSGINTNINIKVDNKAARGVDTLTNRIGVLNTALIEAARNGQTLNVSLSSLGSTINQLGNISRVNNSISSTSKSITSTAKAIAGATSEIQEFGKQSALAVRRFAAFSVVTSGIFSLINAINSGSKAFIAFDQQIIRLRQTTKTGSVAIKDLESEITKLSVNLGVSSEKLAEVSVILAQAGLTANQTKQALSALAKTELAPSFENIIQTTEGAIAAMRQFNIETSDLEKALGSINSVAAAFAVESGDIIAAIQRTGGAFAASSKGVSEGLDALNEFIAVFTSVRATSRESAETIATGLRTIFTRIQRGSTIDFLREFNVELTDLDGKFVGPFEAVKRLSEVLNSLDPRDLRFSQIVEELGGFRQIGKVIPLIQQFATAQEALLIAQRGQGSLAETQATAQLALANQIARVREEFLALIRAVGQSQTFQALFKTVLGLTSGLIKLAGVLKPILPLLTIIGAIKGGSALTQYVGGFVGGLKKTTREGDQNTTTGGLLSTTSNTAAQDRTAATERANAAIAENTSSVRTLTTSIQNLVQAINNRGTSTTGFASGGIVPGSGSRDTVPAMLTPGEFVIRKKAVQSIGTDNLQQINKYAGGGIVQKFKDGSMVRKIMPKNPKTNKSHIGEDIQLTKENIQNYARQYKSKEFFASAQDNAGLTKEDLVSGNFNFSDLIEKMGLRAKDRITLNLPSNWNQALRQTNPDLVAKKDLMDFISDQNNNIFTGQYSRLPKQDSSNIRQQLVSSISSLPTKNYTNKNNPPPAEFPNIPVFDTDNELDSLKNIITQNNLQEANYLDFLFKPSKAGSSYISSSGKLRSRAQSRSGGAKNKLFGLGGLVQKLRTGGSVREIATLQGKSIQDVILEQVKTLGDIKGIKSLLGLSSGDRNLDSVLRASNIKAGKNLPQATDYIDQALSNYRKSGLAQAKAIESATKVAVVGLQPLDKSEVEGPLEIGGKNVVIYIRGLAKQFAVAVNKMKEGIGGTIKGFAENIQSQAIFGGEKPLRLDFDETLVSGADIYNENGQIDITGYSDLNKVKESLKNGRLTPLGEKIKELLSTDPSFADRISVLTARPQSNAELLSQKLNELGLPIPSSKITGTSGGGAAKAAALKETERLIDDNLENVRAARSQNKSAVQYKPIRDLSPQEQAATGLANIEGAILEATLSALGAKGGTIQNRAIDYSMGLGPAAQYFPGIGSDWPTEVKRTLDPNSISRAKEEFARFFEEGGAAKFASGGPVDFYSLEKTSGFSGGDFDAMVRFAKTNGFNIDEFKVFLAKRLSEKKAKSGLKVDPAQLLRDITPSRNVSTATQKALAEMLKGDTDAKYNPKYGNALKRFANGGQVPGISKSAISALSKKLNLDVIENDDNTYDIFDSVYGKTMYEALSLDEVYSKLSSKYKVNPDMLALQYKALGGMISKFATGGSVEDTVPALLTPGEFVINKKAAQKIGYAKLNKLNNADKLQGFNKGGSVGSIQKLASGGFVENLDFARALKLMTEQIKQGASAMVAAREAAKSIEFSLPEAAKFLNDAADNFARTGDITSFGANDESKKLLSDTYDISDGAAAIEALANATQRSADVLALFSEQADQSGISLQKFQANLKEQLANRALDIQGQRKSTRLDLRKEILKGKVSDLSDENVASSLKDALTAQLSSLSGSTTDPNEISNTVNQLITDIADTSKTFDDIKNSSNLLKQAFDVSRDRSEALSAAQEEFSDQLGGLTDAVKVTVNELNAIDYKKSGQAAADFGFLGNARPAQALAFKNSRFGGGLLNTAKSFQESAFLDKIPIIGKKLGDLGKVLEGLPGPIGSAVKAIGGLPGALAAVASIIGSEVIPQLAKAFNMSDNETLAGVGGALSQGGSMAVSLGTLGNQLAGPIGGMIGAIGGAVAGAIKGFSDGIRTKALENSLARLGTQTEKLSKAFEFLSKNDNSLNVANAQKELAGLQDNIKDLSSQAERDAGERAASSGFYGVIGGLVTLLAGAALIATGFGIAPGAVATAAGVTAIAGGIYGASLGPDALDDEALQALLQSIQTYVDGVNKLAERRISLKSLEDLNDFVTEYQDFNKNIDAQVRSGNLTDAEATASKSNFNEQLGRTKSTAVEEAQRGALIRSGRIIDQDRSVAEQIEGDEKAKAIAEREKLLVAEATAMDELKRKYGTNNALIRKESKDKEKLIKRGFELLGIQEYQARAAARLAVVTKQVALETENLIDIYNKVLAGIQAFNSDIMNSQIGMEQSVGVLTGNASMGRVDRRNEEVLKNPRGYDEASFNKALESVAKLAGGGEAATKLTDSIKAGKTLQEQLPDLLRRTSSRDVGVLGDELRKLLKDANIDQGTASDLVDQIVENVEKETSGRKGKSFEDLARSFPALQEILRSTEKAQQVGVALEEAKNNALEQVNKNLDQFSSLMQKAAEWNRKATDILLQGALELDRVLGKGLSLERLNEPFNAEIKAMTAALNGGIGTMDPVTIAENIRNARKQEEELRNQRNALSGVEGDPQNPNKSALEEIVLAQEELGRASRDSYAALEKLATSGTNAANVLSKIEERRQIGKNAANFLERVFTQTGEEAFNMIRSFDAFQAALKGNLNFGNQEQRKMAFEGMNSLLPMLTGPVAGKVQAAMLGQMLRGNGQDLDREFIPTLKDKEGNVMQESMTFRQILDQLANPEKDPVTQQLIETYKQVIEKQAEAAKQLALLNDEAAKDATLVEIKKILESLKDRLPQIAVDAFNRPPNPNEANPRPVNNFNNPQAARNNFALADPAAMAIDTPKPEPVIQAAQVNVNSDKPPEIINNKLALAQASDVLPDKKLMSETPQESEIKQAINNSSLLRNILTAIRLNFAPNLMNPVANYMSAALTDDILEALLGEKNPLKDYRVREAPLGQPNSMYGPLGLEDFTIVPVATVIAVVSVELEELPRATLRRIQDTDNEKSFYEKVLSPSLNQLFSIPKVIIRDSIWHMKKHIDNKTSLKDSSNPISTQEMIVENKAQTQLLEKLLQNAAEQNALSYKDVVQMSGDKITNELIDSMISGIMKPYQLPATTPLIGANNMENINLPALDQIAIAIPQLDTQLLNTVNAFGILDNNLISLKDVIVNLTKSMETSTNNNTGFEQQVTTFGTSVTTFGTSVVNFGASIKSFTSYVERLEKIKFPEKITMGGSYTLDVRVSGAAAFEALETKTKDIINAEIANKLDELQMKIAKATGFAFDPNRRTS